MQIVSFLATFPILCGSAANFEGEEDGVQLNIKSEGRWVSVSLALMHFAQARIDEVEVSDQFLEWLRSTPLRYANNYPSDVADEINKISACLEKAARAVVEAVKYFLNRPDMLENVLGLASEFKCIDYVGIEYELPSLVKIYTAQYTRSPLNRITAADLQSGLDSGWLPLSGMRHFFRAVQEKEPRYRWIDTTIALELSIKEALIRKRPEIETLLLEMPSPPLDKLYGVIMKDVFGVDSPYRNKIKSGVEKRNKLIHRPSGFAVSKEEADEYLTVAHKAITHLFALLYPNWRIAQNMEQMIVNL